MAKNKSLGGTGSKHSDLSHRDLPNTLKDLVDVVMKASDVVERKRSVEGERERIAQEIHNGIAQALYSMALQLKACQKLLYEDPKSVEKKLIQLEKLANEQIKEIRQLVFTLNKSKLKIHSLSSVLKECTREFCRLNVLAGQCRVIGEERFLPAHLENDVYQVVREALSNVAKHAEASKVEVTLKFNQAELELSVEDNGKGFDVNEKLSGRGEFTGMGIKNVERRITRLGGNLRILSRPGAGTRIIVAVPYVHSPSGGKSDEQSTNR